MPVGGAHPVVDIPAQCLPPVDASAASGDDSARPQLLAIDGLLAEYHLERRITGELEARAAAEREDFARAATHALRCVAKPALSSVASRLVDDGAGGRVDEHSPSGRRGMRLVLWMSLDGPIVTTPRQDRNPYLQLDLDVPGRRVRVWEGDMWLGLGASRSTSPLALDELTASVVTDRAVAVLRRAAAYAQGAMTPLLQEGDEI